MTNTAKALLRNASVASDSNPGSSPLDSLLLAVNMACIIFRMTPEDALVGATREAARALGMAEEIGTIGVSKRIGLAIWKVQTPAELAYRTGFNLLVRRLGGARAE